MAQPGDILDTDRERPSKQLPWGWILTVAAFVGLGLLAFWLTHENKNEQAREAVLSILDKELSAQQDAIKAQRQKVMDLTRRLDTLRSMIQTGQVRNGEASVKEFNQLATEQRTERDTFARMAEAYNKRVAKYRELKE